MDVMIKFCPQLSLSLNLYDFFYFIKEDIANTIKIKYKFKKDKARASDPFVLFFKHRLNPTRKDSEESKCLFIEKNIGTEIIAEKIK